MSSTTRIVIIFPMENIIVPLPLNLYYIIT